MVFHNFDLKVNSWGNYIELTTDNLKHGHLKLSMPQIDKKIVQQFPKNSNSTAVRMIILPSQCEYLVLEAPLELEELVDGEVALTVLSEEEGDEAGVDALKYKWR